MFYDFYLDEVFYFGGEEHVLDDKMCDIFDGLEMYSDKEISNFKNGKVTVLRKEKDLEKFIKISRNILSNNEKLYYGKINEEVASKLLYVLSYNLKGFNLSLQRHNYKHIIKKHGNPLIEITKGQINVTSYDFYLIPNILNSYDNLEISYNNEFGNKTFMVTKKIDNIVYHLVMYISFRNHNVEIKTFYKTKKN